VNTVNVKCEEYIIIILEERLEWKNIFFTMAKAYTYTYCWMDVFIIVKTYFNFITPTRV